MQGFIDIPSDVHIVVTLRGSAQKVFDAQRCELRFQAQNKREFIKVEFEKFYISSCRVTFSVNRNSFTCGQSKPTTKLLDSRQVSLVLVRDLDDNQYNANIIVATYSKDYGVVQDDTSNPTLIGIIVGVVCGIIVIILIIAITGHCYYKSMRKKHTGKYDENGPLDDCEQSSIGYINDGVKNGGIIKNNNSPKNNDRSLLSPDDEVKQFYDYTKENKKHTVPNINILANSSTKSTDFDNDPARMGQMNSNATPKSPVLSALHNSPKFQASFKSTEAEAEERAKRFSQGSTSPSTPPPLPTVPTSSQMQCSQTNTNHAGIRRVPKSSASSEDLEHLEKELNTMAVEKQGNQMLPNPPLFLSNVIPISTNMQPQLAPQSLLEQPASEQSILTLASSKDSNSNQHTLRPSRTQDKKKQADITDGQPPKPQKTYKEKNSTNSLRKRGHKIPKFTKGKPFLSDAECNPIYGDEETHHSDTPLSEVSSRMARTDDNESLPPLQRTASKQSLFASRTSLYARRGKRERRSSISESVTSYAHDDLDMYVPSRQPDPMDRRDARVFKSLGDITKTSKDSSCQEQNKKLASKRNGHKKPANTRKSSSSTQTIEQKGTQTEPSQKKTSHGKETIASNTWGKSASNVKGDVINTVQTTEMSKSQFQPISKASDIQSSAFVDNQYLDSVPISVEGAELTKPTKSPWELLCELTDAEIKMRNGSMPSGNALYNSDFPSSVGGQSRPSMDNLPSVYHPSISSRVSEKESYVSAYSPNTVPITYPPSVASNVPNNLYPRKSSWEALKELTDAHLSYNSQGASESIV